MERNVTMQDIADRFGVSKVTVSKALNNKEGVGEELKAKIIEVATEMGYRINSIAQSLKSNNTYNIGFIIAERYTNTGEFQQSVENSTFYMDFYQLVSKVLDEEQYSAILYILSQKDEENSVLPRIYLNNKIDGFIVLGQISHEYIEVLQSTILPIVFLDFYNEYLDMDSITSDNFAGSYLLTNDLIRKGHRELAFVGNIYSTSSIQDRFLGFYKSLLEHKIELKPENIIPDRDETGRFIPLNFPEKMPTAFVCNCDHIANLVVRDLQERGYAIPDDVSVVGFDNSIYSTLSFPQLTTVNVDTYGMAKAGVELLLRKIDNPEYRTGKVAMKGTIIHRESVKDLRRK